MKFKSLTNILKVRICGKIKKKWRRCIAMVVILFVVANITVRKLKQNSDDNVLDHLTEQNIQQLLRIAFVENVKRINNIERVCNKYNLGIYRSSMEPPIYKQPPTPQYEIFYYDRIHKLSWCPIYKAASSTWLYNFALLGGYTEKEILESKIQLSALVRKIYGQLEYSEAEEAFHDSLKFMIVRHPFERILSAYRDKFENMRVRGYDGTYYFYKSYGSKIVSKYRTGGNHTNLRKLLKPGQYYWNPEEKEPIGIEPTFKEFIRFLIDTDLETRADDHWIPNYLFCTPCLLKYEIIGKVETLLQDQFYIIDKAKLSGKIVPKWRHKTNPIIDSHNGNENISEIAKIYFSQLTKDDVRQIYKKYKLDFDLFRYSPDEYYKYTIKDD